MDLGQIGSDVLLRANGIPYECLKLEILEKNGNYCIFRIARTKYIIYINYVPVVDESCRLWLIIKVIIHQEELCQTIGCIWWAIPSRVILS